MTLTAGTFDPYEWDSYFFENISRETSEAILKMCDIGAFLVRLSSSCERGYSLSVRETTDGPRQIHHYLVECVEDEDGKSKFKMHNRLYLDMPSLIAYFKMNKLEHVNLRVPAPKTSIKEVTAMHKFDGERVTDLSFERGESLEILRMPEEGWWVARNSLGTIGLIPSNYVREKGKSEEKSSSRESSLRASTNSQLSDHKSHETLPTPAIVRAIADRRPSVYDSGAMVLKAGQLIHLTEILSSGLCRGTNKATGTTGLFPFTYVEWTNLPVPATNAS